MSSVSRELSLSWSSPTAFSFDSTCWRSADGLLAGLRDVGLEFGDVLALRLDALLELRGGRAQFLELRIRAGQLLMERFHFADPPGLSLDRRGQFLDAAAGRLALRALLGQGRLLFGERLALFGQQAFLRGQRRFELADPFAQRRKFRVIGIQPRHFRARARQLGGGLSQVGGDLVALAASRRDLLPERLDRPDAASPAPARPLRMPSRSAP